MKRVVVTGMGIVSSIGNYPSVALPDVLMLTSSSYTPPCTLTVLPARAVSAAC